MGITPQELRAILRKTEPAAPQGGGFVASVKFGQHCKPLSELTPRQVRAMFHLGKTFR